MKGFGMEE